MKRLLAVIVASLMLPTTPAIAEDYFYWPEYGTFASHSDWANDFIRSKQARALGATGAGVKIAILDDGIADYATEIRDKIVAYKDFVPGQFILGEHGTMVSSTIIADEHPEVGISGVAPDADLMVARVCHRNGCEQEAIYKGIRWAIAEGAQVISISISGYPNARMLALLKIAVAKGVVVVGAMGNNGCQTYGYWGLNPYCLQGTIRESTQVGYPIAGIIALGASNQLGERYTSLGWSSGFGPSLDLIAPGTDVGAFDATAASNGFGGTSSATPFTAATIALMLSIDSTLTPAQVQAILQASATRAVIKKARVWDSCARNATTQVWSCTQEVDSTLPQSYYTGAGVLNAAAAVLLTKRRLEKQLLEPPTLVTSGNQVTISWQDGPADVFVNGDLVVTDAESGYVFTGVDKQSIAVQIRVAGVYSEPAITIVADSFMPAEANLTNISSANGVLRFDAGDLEEQAGVLWRRDSSGDIDYAAVFEADNGQTFDCAGSKRYFSQIAYFECFVPRGVTLAAGNVRLMGKNGDLGAPSDHISQAVTQSNETIEVSANYPDSGLPSFTWTEVVGAQSYKVRYESEAIFHCQLSNQLTLTSYVSTPVVLDIEAYPNLDCSGNLIAINATTSYTMLPVKPEKPTGMFVKSVGVDFIEFEIPNRNPTTSWRIYRSDGLMTRINAGQRMFVGLQANENVNDLSFSFRFREIKETIWADSWSELSDSITASYLPLPAPGLTCSKNIFISCRATPTQQVTGTVLEFLDGEMNIVTTRTVTQVNDVRLTRSLSRIGITFVRTYSYLGLAQNRNSWYRRGKEKVMQVGLGRAALELAQPK